MAEPTPDDVQFDAGLRINEALSLYPKDLELADGSVRVLHGKGGRSRTVGLDPGAAAIISRQLGHTSITTTARYLDHIAPRAVIEAMRSRDWTGA